MYNLISHSVEHRHTQQTPAVSTAHLSSPAPGSNIRHQHQSLLTSLAPTCAAPLLPWTDLDFCSEGRQRESFPLTHGLDAPQPSPSPVLKRAQRLEHLLPRDFCSQAESAQGRTKTPGLHPAVRCSWQVARHIENSLALACGARPHTHDPHPLSVCHVSPSGICRSL